MGVCACQVPFFADAAPGFVPLLVRVLRPMTCGVGEVVLEEGTLGANMFFVLKGQLAVAVRGLHVATITAPQAFGEFGALMSTERTSTVRAATFCDFYTLDRYHDIL